MRALLLLAVLSAPAGAQTGGFDAETANAAEWRRELGFTADQGRRFEAAGEERARAVEPLKERLRATLERVKTLAAGSPDEVELAAELAELSRLRAAVQRENARYDETLASFLSPSQRARLMMLLQGARPALERAAFRTRS